jgi:hypothetical protein
MVVQGRVKDSVTLQNLISKLDTIKVFESAHGDDDAHGGDDDDGWHY